MLTTTQDNDNEPGLQLPRFTTADMLKIVGTVVFVAMAWARMENGLTQIEKRFDKMDELYVRKDVNEQQMKAINDNLVGLRIQVERIEMKLEK